MTRIFGEDKEVMRNEGNERALRARKASLRELHRGEIKDAGITLSQPFQERVRALLEREVPTPASEYFTLKQMKLKFPKVNFNELTKISERIRANHPEWYCRTKNVNGGRPSFSLLRTFEREFITAANELIEEWILPRRY